MFSFWSCLDWNSYWLYFIHYQFKHEVFKVCRNQMRNAPRTFCNRLPKILLVVCVRDFSLCLHTWRTLKHVGRILHFNSFHGELFLRKQSNQITNQTTERLHCSKNQPLTAIHVVIFPGIPRELWQRHTQKERDRPAYLRSVHSDPSLVVVRQDHFACRNTRMHRGRVNPFLHLSAHRPLSLGILECLTKYFRNKLCNL